MSIADQSPLATLDTTLHAARQQRALQLRAWLGRPDVARSLLHAARWTGLVVASLLSAALVARHGLHIEFIMLAIALASVASSIAGFAFSAISGAMLFHLSHDPVQVVQIMITCSIANQVAMTWSIRRSIDWQGLSVYLAGGAFGLMVGVWILLHAHPAAYTQALGIFLLTYGAFMLFRRPVVLRRRNAAFDLAVGFLGGITGGAAGFPGAAVTIWCGMQGWDKTRQRATVQPFILIMQVVALVAISLARHPGSSGSGFDVSYLLFIPVSLLGTALGLVLYRRMSDRQFARAVNVLLIVSGVSYVV